MSFRSIPNIEMGLIGGCSEYHDRKIMYDHKFVNLIGFYLRHSKTIIARTSKHESASGCPGSHVIIRCHDQKLNEDVVMDAAALAARQSKCNGNIIKVSMTRARDVKKPLGAKAGLVELTGQVRTVTVNMKEVQVRLCRLDETMLIN
mmetsp:Transcript_24504/g.57594  ORF Transcript_24504/g.57594 Transcript_24504/m.57594 type:complete len:147 (+) Transcript_24504:876-1316(+)